MYVMKPVWVLCMYRYIYGLYTAPNPFLSIGELIRHFTIYLRNKLCHHQVVCKKNRIIIIGLTLKWLGKVFTSICTCTQPFRFVYLTADVSALSHSLYSADIYISCSVHKCERHNNLIVIFLILILKCCHFILYLNVRLEYEQLRNIN